MEHGTVTTPQATLAYRRRTSSGAPTLLLLHGITDGGAVWTRVADALADRFDIVMPDARGHGASARLAADPTVEALVEDAAAIVEALDLGPVLVWGHSMGAETAARLAAARPDLVRGLILEDPPFAAEPADDASGATTDDPHLRAFIELLSSVREMSDQERLAMARRENPGWHEDELAPWAQTKAQLDHRALALLDGGLGRAWRAALEGIECTTLLVTGDPERGAIVTPEVASEAATVLRHGQVRHIAGAGHSIHRDRFADALAAAAGLLDRIVPPTGGTGGAARHADTMKI
ncbi:alpha/beta fold hydrolase [Demequina pelophila]|uniref:alpha/beta fold hydrolase n=1 Tax=Demequina pelophila TaxID=1638984 RepID=UPI0007808B1D|nr:alpha/beta hydrolase [Demequina pelophila]